jgi:hypothetical protein
MIAAFADGMDTEETIRYYHGKFGDADPRQFVDVLVAHAVLVDPKEDEVAGMWAYVPIKGKWNVWQRRPASERPADASGTPGGAASDGAPRGGRPGSAAGDERPEHDDRLVLWTAWGDRPVQQLFLDPDETKIWDAFDGQKRLIEIRHHFDNAKLIALVRRLVHNDVQAIKLSVMPWSIYAKRPAMAPP